ncbi:hypothetical protein AXH82_12315 [Microbacterium sp. PAMC 28756]|nr:hypothetical protein AXH82_12315 [Microbacterium sp. PAMC 28756]
MRGDGPGGSHPGEREASGVAADELTVQERPGRIASGVLGVPAAQTRRDPGDHERPHGDARGLDRDGQVRVVGAQHRGELHGGRRAGDEDDGDRRRPPLLGRRERHALVLERLAQPPLRARVGEAERGDAGGARRSGLILQRGFDDGQQPSRLGPRCTRAVRDDVERAAPESSAHAAEDPFDPRCGGRDPDAGVVADLEGRPIAPEQRERGIETGQGRRGERHPSILRSRARPQTGSRDRWRNRRALPGRGGRVLSRPR